MNGIGHLSNLRINEVLHNSIKRPSLSVHADSNLVELTTFLAIGPEIYVDGLIVVAEFENEGTIAQTPIGRVGGKNILSCILHGTFDYLEDFFRHTSALQVMDRVTQNDCVDLRSLVSGAIEIFQRTKFAFVPIISTLRVDINNKPILVGALGVRDFLPLIINQTIGVDSDDYKEDVLNQISSPLISVNQDTTIRNAISIMMNQGIRNLGIDNGDYNDICTTNEAKGRAKNQGSELLGFINDRKILEFLLSQNERKLTDPLSDKVSNIEIIEVNETKPDTTIRVVAKYLMDVKNPFLVLEGKDSIITPWDLVMCTFGKIK